MPDHDAGGARAVVGGLLAPALGAAAAIGAASAVLAPWLPPALRFAIGAAVAMWCGVVVLAPGLVGWSVRQPPHAPALPAIGALMIIRGAAWALFAVDAWAGGIGLPSAGDLVSPVTGLLAIGIAVGRWPSRDRGRTQVLGLDALIVGSGLLCALWLIGIGPKVGFALGTSAALVVFVLSAIFVGMLVIGALVLSRGVLSRSSLTAVALLLITIADVSVLATALTPDREPSSLALVCWTAGWPLLAWRAVFSRQEWVESAQPEHSARREIFSTDVATVVAAAAFLAVVVVAATRGEEALVDHVTAALCISATAGYVARELLLGRDRVRLIETLGEQAVRDPLTRLVNRRGVTQQLAALAPDAEWVIAAVDLDGFKAVNDIHGHDTGDDVLVATATVLRACCPPDGIVARTGGDEFALLLPGDVARGRAVGEIVVRHVAERLAALRLAPTITASVGVGRLLTGPGRAGTGSGLPPTDRLSALVEAAAALRAAKAAGRNRVEIYPGAVAAARERRLLVERRLRAAVRVGAIHTVVQPIVLLDSGAIVGVEVLARWHDGELGDVPPDEFIPVAEQTGLITELGAQVLRQALDEAVRRGLPGLGLHVGVNVSPVQLRSAGFVDVVRTALRDSGMPPALLVLEVTEAVLIEDDDPALPTLSALAAAGAQLAIDDFGSGYGALGYLRGLPVGVLKIDRLLFVEAGSSERTRRIVSGIVDLAHRIHLQVAIEGVETPAGARLCTVLGADTVQGMLYGAPTGWDVFAERAGAQPVESAVGQPLGSLTIPSWATEATRTPSRLYTRPRPSPRESCADGLSST